MQTGCGGSTTYEYGIAYQLFTSKLLNMHTKIESTLVHLGCASRMLFISLSFFFFLLLRFDSHFLFFCVYVDKLRLAYVLFHAPCVADKFYTV